MWQFRFDFPGYIWSRKMTNVEQSKINWDDVDYAIRTALTKFEADEDRHLALAKGKKLSRYEYLAALTTQEVQAAVDFTFQESHDWKTVYAILSAVYKDYESDSKQNWLDNAHRSKLPIRDYVSAKLTRYVAEVIDFESYMSANG
jgi:hypothetical protein